MYLNLLNDTLRRTYGCKVYKLALSSGCTCPNRDGTLGRRGCVFCDGSGAFAASGPLPEQLTRAKARVAAKAGPDARYIAYFQSFTNTYGDLARLEALYRAALEPEDIVALSLATRPDCLGPEALAMLERLRALEKPVWVELGLQSIHPASALWTRRGWELPAYDEALRQLRGIGVSVIAHQILGIPGESLEDMAATAQYIGQSGADGIKLHLLHVIAGTDLEALWRAGQVPVMELPDYIAALEACIRRLHPEIVIHRLTGDGDKRTLLAPLWSADKKRVLNAIRAAFARDDLIQGSALSPALR